MNIKFKIESSILYYQMIKRNCELLYDEKYLVYKFSVTSEVWHNFFGWGQ